MIHLNNLFVVAISDKVPYARAGEGGLAALPNRPASPAYSLLPLAGDHIYTTKVVCVCGGGSTTCPASPPVPSSTPPRLRLCDRVTFLSQHQWAMATPCHSKSKPALARPEGLQPLWRAAAAPFRCLVPLPSLRSVHRARHHGTVVASGSRLVVGSWH